MGTVWRFAVLGTAMFWLMLVLVAQFIPLHAAELGTLTIRVENVSPKGGMLRLGLYDEANYADDTTAAAHADVPVKPGENVITLHGIAPGTYAIEAFQDINSNGKMDTSWIGLPQEPFGFSRDARPRLSKPRFAAVSIAVAAGENEHSFSLQHSVFGGRHESKAEF